jgi:hypothetical protein
MEEDDAASVIIQTGRLLTSPRARNGESDQLFGCFLLFLGREGGRAEKVVQPWLEPRLDVRHTGP